MTSFRYDKENLFKEFEIAKNKDLKRVKILIRIVFNF
jgi:hypothetical protein